MHMNLYLKELNTEYSNISRVEENTFANQKNLVL